MKVALTSVFVLAALVAGCAAVNQMAGLGVLSEDVSKFDGTRMVEVSGNFVPGVPIKIGARWISSEADQALVTLNYVSDIRSGNAYTAFHEFAVNLNGEITRFPVTGGTAFENSAYNTVSQTIYTESRSGVVMPLAYLERMLAAESCMIKVSTADGYSEGNFALLSNGGAPTAKASLRQFYDRVATYR